jgi:HK97 family phage major capsid protein
MASRIKELRQKKADLAAELGEAKEKAYTILDAADAEKRATTAEEEKSYAAVEADIKRLTTAIARNDQQLVVEEEAQEQERQLAARMPAQPVRDDAASHIQMGRDLAAERPFSSLGEQLVSIWRASQPAHGVDPRLLRLNAAATGSNETVPSDGGYLLQPEFSTEIVR